jgi:hypothetical protein
MSRRGCRSTFEAIGRGDPQVADDLGGVEDQKLPECNPLGAVIELADSLPLPEPQSGEFAVGQFIDPEGNVVGVAGPSTRRGATLSRDPHSIRL